VKLRAATNEDRQLALLWLAAAVSAVALRPLWLALAPLLRPCVFRALSGVPCPTCGTTRAATAFLNTELTAAFAANPLAVLAGLVFVVGAPLAVAWTMTRRNLPSVTGPLPVSARVAAVSLIGLNWIYVIFSS
jgi:hypothetical protein